MKHFWQEVKEDAAKHAYRRAHGVDLPDSSRSQYDPILTRPCNTTRRPNNSTPRSSIPSGSPAEAHFNGAEFSSTRDEVGTRLAQVNDTWQSPADRTSNRSHTSRTDDISGSTAANRPSTVSTNATFAGPINSAIGGGRGYASLPPPPYNEEDERRRAGLLQAPHVRSRDESREVPERTSSRPHHDPTTNTAPFLIRTTPSTSPTTISSPTRLPDCHIFGCSDDGHLLDCRLRMAEVGRYYCHHGVAFRECRSGCTK